ncbi:MAG: hypothetical protein ACT4QB_12575 [Gammaproteobacteria bacterium]
MVLSSKLSPRLGPASTLVLHAARVAFKEYDGQAELTAAQVGAADIQAVYEVKGRASDGTLLEADIQADAVLLELEIEISRQEVPQNVREAARRFAHNFEASGRVTGDREEHSSERRWPAGDLVRVQWRDF